MRPPPQPLPPPTASTHAARSRSTTSERDSNRERDRDQRDREANRPSTPRAASRNTRAHHRHPREADDEHVADDDEVKPFDRGEDLVKRRFRERQRERRRLEKQQTRPSTGTIPPTGSTDRERAYPQRPGIPPGSAGLSEESNARQSSTTLYKLPAAQRGSASAFTINQGQGQAQGPSHSQFLTTKERRQSLASGPESIASYEEDPNALAGDARRFSHAPSDFGTDASEADSALANESTELWSRGRPTGRNSNRSSSADPDVPRSRAVSAATFDIEAHAGDSSVDETARAQVPAQQRTGYNDPDPQDQGAIEEEEQEEDAGNHHRGDRKDDDEGGEDEDEDEDREDHEDVDHDDDDDDEDVDNDDVEYTLKDRQDAINIEHPFGLPIWKPALYKKNRSITRNAETALHNMPSVAAERHLLPGNMLWTLLAGSWLSILCFVLSMLLYWVPVGGPKYARVMRELGAYIFWPFGKYVEVELVPHARDSPSGEEIDFAPATEQEGEGTHTPENQEARTYENDFTPVVARFPHDHTHQVPFNARFVRSPPSQSAPSYSNSHDSSGSTSPSASRLTDATMLPQHHPPQASETTPLTSTAITNYGAAPSTPRDFPRSLSAELKDYGYVYDAKGRDVSLSRRWAGKLAYGLVFYFILGPLMGVVCLLCWGGVFSIPMAKLTWILLKNLASQPLALHMHSAESAKQISSQEHRNYAAAAPPFGPDGTPAAEPRPGLTKTLPHGFVQKIVSSSPERHSTILLCTYRAVGWQYYKYTLGGVNILFVNTLPLVFFTIFDFFFLSPWLTKHGFTSGFWGLIASHGLIFILALGSVIPLSYFIGMAVASISAQSSIGMGAVINATFGSIIEIILYSIALTQEKARLVEGSIIGSILAGVLLMPGLSMISGASRRKEQRFNARSAGVTSTMLIMAIIGILTPTLFYQIYGTFQLTCKPCPDDSVSLPGGHNGTSSDDGEGTTCRRCFYEHIPPDSDEFFQTSVQSLIYTCTVFLVLSYGVGLWFSLRTHASQIWQNPTTNLARENQPGATQGGSLPPSAYGHALPGSAGAGLRRPPSNSLNINTNPGIADPQRRNSIYKRLTGLMPSQLTKSGPGPNQRRTSLPDDMAPLHLPEPEYGRTPALAPRTAPLTTPFPASHPTESVPSTGSGVVAPFSGGQSQQAGSRSPRMRSRTRQTSVPPRLSLTEAQQTNPPHNLPHNPPHNPPRHEDAGHGESSGGGGGHDGPSWSRTVSMSVLLGCTVLYAIIAEVLVDVVDVVLEGSGLDEKFLGVTLFALVPNTTEFMNAMSFAINGNIALSMEIGSAYTLQVCLIQIPAMVAFSAWYNAHLHGAPSMTHIFTLIFPRWDVLAIVFSIFLITYTYIEARSNYHRGSYVLTLLKRRGPARVLFLFFVPFVWGSHAAPCLLTLRLVPRARSSCSAPRANV